MTSANVRSDELNVHSCHIFIAMALYFLGHEKGNTAALATWVGVGESPTERSIDADIIPL